MESTGRNGVGAGGITLGMPTDGCASCTHHSSCFSSGGKEKSTRWSMMLLLAEPLKGCGRLLQKLSGVSEILKTTTKKTPLVSSPVIFEPFSRIVMDIVGPLPRSQSWHRYVLVICDCNKISRSSTTMLYLCGDGGRNIGNHLFHS